MINGYKTSRSVTLGAFLRMVRMGLGMFILIAGAMDRDGLFMSAGLFFSWRGEIKVAALFLLVMEAHLTRLLMYIRKRNYEKMDN